MTGMSKDMCRTVGMALGAALALVLLLSLSQPLGLLPALLLALIAAAAVLTGFNRFLCASSAGQGPVQASVAEAREAVAAPAGEMQPGAIPAPEVAPKAASVAKPELAEVEPPVVEAPATETVTKDDLQQLKGVGPKLAQALNDAGVLSFAQIASWTEADVAWVEENVKGARGRIGRDGWIAQAQALTAATEAAD
ncbi:Predicted 5' DNA nuclease, flap endonuclease-1-like, helix-3-turn-helix (H3TH) domain [Pseudooceanicola antarcticus]|uniref:Predicted 5' DNA nuclease, flap endonuclease-1-like, helix-3-turn-helix (H3TH) domain n=1 Tax=Pseudooceanicola antarcticus TaxID=1247613 RepID=A0A285J4V3_9RHOB|nr:helix-hairpin-helix domain-containing protein [Pseudooceanicola antarcticus]SNY54406.1 Predicted 5' DNA nuclease, flap endonuclease-1-like, helix-3-turn-helix (H3TH) domain [Pseudooceanicola antarcticus]